MKVQIGAEYSAMEIAEYAVNRRYRLDMPISNLQLQKILYFLQVIYASKTDKLLFADQFEAWPYGPVIRDVYVEFSDCGGFPIKRAFYVEIEEPLRSFLDAVRDGGKAPVPTEQIIYNQAILDGIRRSAEAGREVTIEVPEV